MVVKPMVDAYDQYIPYPQYLKLLVRATDATTSGMKDFSGYARPVTNSTGATGSTAQVKLTPYSMYFNGSNQYFTVANSSDFEFGSGNFTISWWEYKTDNTGNNTHPIIGRDATTVNMPWTIVDKTGNVVYYASSDGTSWDISLGTIVGELITNEFVHRAIIRDSSAIKFYQNGILKATITTTASFVANSNALSIGKIQDNTNTYHGYIDELCLWKGIAVPISQLYPQRKPFSFRRA